MKAIETKYLSATDTRGVRIKATVGKLTATVPYDYSLTDQSEIAFMAAFKGHSNAFKGHSNQ